MALSSIEDLLFFGKSYKHGRLLLTSQDLSTTQIVFYNRSFSWDTESSLTPPCYRFPKYLPRGAQDDSLRLKL